MIRAYHPEYIREADRRAVEIGVSGAILMENAGADAARLVGEAALVLCGPGNNGGDGYVAARHLACMGHRTEVISAVSPERLGGDAACAHRMCEPFVRVQCSSDMDDAQIRRIMASYPVVVDALLGTGTSGPPRGEVARLIGILSDFGGRVVSFDIPSGVDGRTGAVPSCAVRSHETFTFLAPKTGLYVHPGSEHAGKITVCPIGAPTEHILDGYGAEIFTSSDIPSLSPAACMGWHKGTRGTVLVIGGCSKYRGAPYLSCRGALRAGGGVVIAAVPEESVHMCGLPEVILCPCPTEDGHMTERILPHMEEYMKKAASLVIGPGIGRGAGALVKSMLSGWHKPAVVDADAIEHAADLARDENRWLTPHDGEAARLLGRTAPWVSANRLEAACEIYEKFGPVLLKGPNTILCGPKGIRIAAAGGPVLAVPGSGDVLSGVIGALMASMNTSDAVTLGALLHGASGDILSAKRGPNGTLASEIADCITRVRR